APSNTATHQEDRRGRGLPHPALGEGDPDGVPGGHAARPLLRGYRAPVAGVSEGARGRRGANSRGSRRGLRGDPVEDPGDARHRRV
ncbi:MAG: hypothetical protein AVDCRST_MAG12-544, partial [uncultured Rubrobacteraceae bacterium]